METNVLNGVFKGFSARGCTADIVTPYTLDAKNVARILRWGARVHRSGKTAASTVEKRLGLTLMGYQPGDPPTGGAWRSTTWKSAARKHSLSNGSSVITEMVARPK